MAVPCSPEAGHAYTQPAAVISGLPARYWCGMSIALGMWAALAAAIMIVTG